MHLYEVPRRSIVRLVGDDSGETFLFDHIDGAYSLCKKEDGSIIHLSANAEVAVVKARDVMIGYGE